MSKIISVVAPHKSFRDIRTLGYTSSIFSYILAACQCIPGFSQRRLAYPTPTPTAQFAWDITSLSKAPVRFQQNLYEDLKINDWLWHKDYGSEKIEGIYNFESSNYPCPVNSSMVFSPYECLMTIIELEHSFIIYYYPVFASAPLLTVDLHPIYQLLRHTDKFILQIPDAYERTTRKLCYICSQKIASGWICGRCR